MTLFDYVLALCILLGSLLVLSAAFYAVLRLRRNRQASAVQREVP